MPPSSPINSTRGAAVASIILLAVLSGCPRLLNGQVEVPSIRGINNSLGFREHRPGHWSYLNPEIRNPSNREAHLEVVVFFASAQHRKFAKRVRVPAKTTLRTSVPVFLPGTARRGIDVQVQLYDLSGEEPVLLIRDRKRSYDTAISVRNSLFGEGGSNYRSSAMFQSVLEPLDEDQEMALETVSAARISFNHNGRVGYSTTMFLPESFRAFDSVDQIVLHNDHLLNDTAGMDSVRRWLARGGNLWVMLDLVSEETVRRLLGDDIPFQLIDRTSLNTVQIKDADIQSQAADPRPRSFEEPVEFARVVLTGGNLVHSHDGWPASFWTRSNGGKVFFTTIGARAWIRDRNSRVDGPQKERLGLTRYAITDPMEQIGYQLYVEEKPGDGLDVGNLKSELVNQIGYRVLGRNTVILILASYTGILVLLGWWLNRLRRLDRLFFLGPGLAMLVALVFYLAGVSRQQAAPPTVATFQKVQPIAGGDELQVDGMTILYSRDQREYSVMATNDGELVPTPQRQEATLEKTAWDTRGHWQNVNGTIEPGLTAFLSKGNVAAADPITASAVFTARGLEGKMNSGAFELSEAVLALPGGRFMEVPTNADDFLLDSGNELPPNQFLQSNLLDDVQRWRQSIYASQFPDGKWENWVARPTLFGWTPPLETDVRFPEDFRLVGGALHRIPLEFQRTEPGEKVLIPAAFIPVSNAINSRNALSANFDSKSRKWVGSISRESTTRLRFQLPREVLPLEIQSATLSFDSIRAPDRKVEIKRVDGSERAIVETLSNPAGAFTREFTAVDQLSVSESGELFFDIDIFVNPDFYVRQKEVDEEIRSQKQRNKQLERQGQPAEEIKLEKIELKREEISGIRLSVTGSVSDSPR
ncbi:MAG: hypothetical protein VX768_15200 [Planctomycetota bacterium]|nr:hypothetical protein [Planctomycetota bacterium]